MRSLKVVCLLSICGSVFSYGDCGWAKGRTSMEQISATPDYTQCSSEELERGLSGVTTAIGRILGSRRELTTVTRATDELNSRLFNKVVEQLKQRNDFLLLKLAHLEITAALEKRKKSE